ncbi:MAG: SpoIID/LytB domain-containing protein [Actinobacteria bacterium]|nr:SpoIID/LytB domain-containing protein [Actinomycetota bacterium]MBU1944245.1 SpoIID/LytB domain-containing protein [Actinomycetota bacterium]MBU2688014.1 SpoIID/LytB domain-containing protein [Actinomycetota bacterium]
MIFIRDLWGRTKETFSFLGFPGLVAIACVLALSIGLLVVRGDGRDLKTMEWKPEWNETPRERPESGSYRGEAPEQSAPGSAVIQIPAGGTAAAPAAASTESSASLSSGTPVPGGDSVFMFKQYGRAHGVGLCMDGVKYRAAAGQSCMDIINYYYTGVTVRQIDDNQPVTVKGRDGSVRTLSMKEYLYHLAEEPEDYPAEGLKVLYIAARTYVLSCRARGKHQGYDLCSSGGCCQAFDENKDISKSPNNCAAVDATAGQVLYYADQPITAAYCGSCGGHTENNEDVWGGTAIPYLRGKPDQYCSKSSRYCTTKEISVRDLSGKLGVGTLKMIDLSDRTPGGRVRTAKITGESGSKTMSGKDFAKVLGFGTAKIEYSFK